MDTANDPFEYDVAFSFLAQDEAIALQLNDLLQERFKTFLYSERQKELAGRDGEVAFNEVFAAQARSVVVIYREGWGQTPWTRIEETAIRNRAHSEGYDFCLFVPLGDRASVPRWLPKNRLWIGYDRWGATGTAAVIEARVSELGGTPHVETLEDFAAREGRKARFEAERASALNRGDLSQLVTGEAAKVTSALRAATDRFNGAQDAIRLTFHQTKPGHAPAITGLLDGLTFNFHIVYANNLDGSDISATIWDGTPPLPGFLYLEKPTPRKKLKIKFEYSTAQEYVWETGGRQYTPPQLAEVILQWYIKEARRR